MVDLLQIHSSPFADTADRKLVRFGQVMIRGEP
jgi:hypothetical protein